MSRPKPILRHCRAGGSRYSLLNIDSWGGRPTAPETSFWGPPHFSAIASFWVSSGSCMSLLGMAPERPCSRGESAQPSFYIRNASSRVSGVGNWETVEAMLPVPDQCSPSDHTLSKMHKNLRSVKTKNRTSLSIHAEFGVSASNHIKNDRKSMTSRAAAEGIARRPTLTSPSPGWFG